MHFGKLAATDTPRLAVNCERSSTPYSGQTCVLFDVLKLLLEFVRYDVPCERYNSAAAGEATAGCLGAELKGRYQ